MKEGIVSPNADRAPSISLDESIKRWEAHRLVKDLPGVRGVVSAGARRVPVDPAGYNKPTR